MQNSKHLWTGIGYVLASALPAMTVVVVLLSQSGGLT